jgi:hypothetical protein
VGVVAKRDWLEGVEEPSPCPLPGTGEGVGVVAKRDWLEGVEEPSPCPLPEYRERGKRERRQAVTSPGIAIPGLGA